VPKFELYKHNDEVFNQYYGIFYEIGTFWLKIEQFWPFEEILIFSHGGHLGYRKVLTDTVLKGDHPRIIQLYKHNDELLNKYYGI
jgi:hypothetical protein